MEKIKIDKITKKENIREDYGDLTELAQSIKQHGVRDPIELNSNNEIIDGHRRFIAAKAAGLKEMPFFYTDNKIDEKTSQMIAGIFQKNLNVVEEGRIFQQYMEEESMTSEQLAARISKRKDYIEKRIVIAKLPTKIQTALIKKKIQIGHALLLARVPGEARYELLKEIIDDELGVKEAKEQIGYSYRSSDLKDAPFCKTDCAHCIHNGSKQAELFETGAILSGKCMNQKCFNKKLREFIDKKKEEFKDVLHKGDRYDCPEGFVNGGRSWDCDEFKITDSYKEKCKEKGIGFYLVHIDDCGRISEYFVKRPQKNEAGEIETPEVVEKKESPLLSKVTEFKKEFLKTKTKDIMLPSEFNTKQLTVIRMMQNAGYYALDSQKEKFEGIIDMHGHIDIEKLLNATDEMLDIAMCELSKYALDQMGVKELILVSRNFDVNVEKDFVITEDYLKLYTKDQLSALMEELEINEVYNLKKQELITYILEQNLNGKVPKVML